MSLVKKTALISIVLTVIFAVCSCKDNKTLSSEDYLGDYSYDSSLYALVFEPVEDEDEYGIQYREIKDFDGLINTGDTFCLYFYNSMDTENYGITAAIEDISQATYESMTIIAVDAMNESDIVSKYEIAHTPEFILVSGGEVISAFDSFDRGYWTSQDLTEWISENGIRVNYSNLDIGE